MLFILYKIYPINLYLAENSLYKNPLFLRETARGPVIFKIFKPHLLANAKLDWAETWSEALGRHGESELLKLFHSNIQDGQHFETLQQYLHPNRK